MKDIKRLWKLIIMGLIGILTVFTSSYGTSYEAKEVKNLPIYSVYTQDKVVALTFDVAWGAEDVEEILGTLEKYNVKATFFIVGDWVRKYPEKVKMIAAAGHDIANHSNKHPHMNQMSKDAIKKDIMDAHGAIRQAIGKDIHLFRPPYGEYNNTVIEAAKECDYHTIQWDVDSLDWKEYGLDPLINKVLTHKNLGPGSIILMHNGTKHTKDALDTILKGLTDKGYRLVPISELILKDNYKLDHSGRQYPLS